MPSALHLRESPPESIELLVVFHGFGLCVFFSFFVPVLFLCRRKDSSALQRSASIDSFAEIVFSESPRPSLAVTGPGACASASGGPSPFSKRPSASSLYSTSTSSSFASQVQAQLNVNYGDSALGSGSATGGPGSGHHHGASGGGNGGSSASSSRRESMLSPSSTRRSKLTRIINGECGVNRMRNLKCIARRCVPYAWIVLSKQAIYIRY